MQDSQQPQNIGNVVIIGAGPGDPGLLTQRAYERLASAEVVLYDALLTDSLMALIPQDAEKINVGKRAGNHIKSQDEINALLVQKAREGKRVVRFKGGDPYMFGRGAEEAVYCDEHGIPVEVIPGLSSALTVPAMAGIPVLHRDYAGSVLIRHGQVQGPPVKPETTEEENRPSVVIKRHKGKKKLSKVQVTGEAVQKSCEAKLKEIDWEATCKAADTLVFLMFFGSRHMICDGLLYGGRNKDEPVAIIQWGATNHQKVLISSVENFADDLDNADIGTPAVLVVGEVVNFREQLNFFERRVLFGKRFVMTSRSAGRDAIRTELEDLGATCRWIPLIDTPPLADSPKELDSITYELEHATHFVLSNADLASIFEVALERSGFNSYRVLSEIPFLCSTQEVLSLVEESGLTGALLPERITPSSLKELTGLMAKETRLLMIEEHSEWNELSDELEDCGARVSSVPVRTTQIETEALDKLKTMIQLNQVDIVVWERDDAILSAVDYFGSEAEKLFDSVAHLCTNASCVEVLQGFQVQDVYECESFTKEKLLQSLEEFLAWEEN